MRILFLSIEYPPESPNGIGSYAVEITAAMAQRGHEVHVLSCIPGQAERDYRDGAVMIHRRSDPPVRRVARRALGNVAEARLRHAWACWRHARALGLDFDVIESPDWMAEGLLFALAGRPVVTFLHSPLCLTSRFSALGSSRDLRVASWIEHFTITRARAVTAPSRLVVDALRAEGWLGKQPVEIIRYPISIERWRGIRSVAKTAPVVLFTGRLERLKAPEVLVDAMARLGQRHSDVEAWLAGRSSDLADGGQYIEWLNERVARLKAPCRLLGEQSRDEVHELASCGRVLAVPSRYESFSYSGLEALAAGRPVVCTRATGLAEILEGSGAGAVVPTDDPIALARALEPYIEDVGTAVRAGRKARELVARLCSAESVAAQREELYERVGRSNVS